MDGDRRPTATLTEIETLPRPLDLFLSLQIRGCCPVSTAKFLLQKFLYELILDRGIFVSAIA